MKVLIVTSKFGMGHLAAARALEAQIRESGLAEEITVADICRIAFPRRYESVYRFYTLLTAKTCKLFNLAYKTAVRSELTESSRRNFLEKYIIRKLGDYIETVEPDVCVSTYSLAARFLSDYKRAGGSRLPLVTCITDLSIHNVWTNPETDLYLVAAPATKASLIRQGVAPGNVAVCGIPVAETYDRLAERRRTGASAPSLGIGTSVCAIGAGQGAGRGTSQGVGQGTDKDAGKATKELLVMGGGLGLLPEDMEFYRRLDALEGVHSTVICGKNESLFLRLQAENFEKIEVLGFCDRVADYMGQAHALLSKPGGISTFEAIHGEVPLIAFAPFFEQEVKNGEYIEKENMGRVLSGQGKDSIEEIHALVMNDELLNSFRSNMRRVKEELRSEALTVFLRDVNGAAQAKAAGRAA